MKEEVYDSKLVPACDFWLYGTLPKIPKMLVGNIHNFDTKRGESSQWQTEYADEVLGDRRGKYFIYERKAQFLTKSMGRI